MSYVEEFASFKEQVNIVFVVDHAGRAGNGFFQTIFDQHPQVIACPWMHYVYSYVIHEFGEDENLNAKELWEKWRSTIYFSSLYNDLNDENRAFITKIGGDPDSELDRERLRDVFDQILGNQETISRKDFVAAIFFSYAAGLNRDHKKIKYIMCPDSISLRNESAMTGFSGKVVDVVIQDFPDAKMIHLERDPRAGFASSNHQFVNQLGNMYGLKFGQFWRRFFRLLKKDFDWDSVFVFGFWAIYFQQTFKAIRRKREAYEAHFLTVKNEDLNLNFKETVSKLAGDLGIDLLPLWTDDFEPTMLGRPWTGTGAYNSQYQKSVHGPLRNDARDVAKNVTGPNKYVTKRWRSRLSVAEIHILEILLQDEIRYFDYDFIHRQECKHEEKTLSKLLWRPLKGELPNMNWLMSSKHVGFLEFLNRIFYCLTFPVFYITSRMVFMSIYKKSKVFK